MQNNEKNNITAPARIPLKLSEYSLFLERTLIRPSDAKAAILPTSSMAITIIRKATPPRDVLRIFISYRGLITRRPRNKHTGKNEIRANAIA
jgi:hypothetical protein